MLKKSLPPNEFFCSENLSKFDIGWIQYAFTPEPAWELRAQYSIA